MAYGSGLLGDFWSGYGQRRAASGRPLTAREMSGLMTPLLDYSAAESKAAGEREMRQAELDRQYALQQEQQNAAQKSGVASAVSQAAGLGVSGYLGYKTLGAQAENAAANRALAERIAGLGTPSSPAPAAAVGAANGGGAAASGVAEGAANFAPRLASATPQAGLPAAEALAGEGAASTAGASSLTSTLGPAALGGGIGSYLGGRFHEKLGVNEDIGQGIGGVAGGAMAGFMVGGPVGAGIGALVGGAISLVDDLF